MIRNGSKTVITCVKRFNIIEKRCYKIQSWDANDESNDFTERRPRNQSRPQRRNIREPSQRFQQQQPQKHSGVSFYEQFGSQSDRLLMPNPYNVTEENRVEVLNEVVAPLHTYSYEHQLSMFHNDAASCLRRLARKLIKVNPQFRLTDRGLPCYLDPAIGSPVTTAYRSRTEFSIWPGMDGNPKTVGFFVGSPGKHENVVCVSPEGCITLKESHVKFAKLFQDYLRTVSQLDVCLEFSDGKNWRNFVVRSNENGDNMLIAILHPQKLTQDELENEKELLRNYFEPLAEEHQIKSFYFQASSGNVRSHEQSPYQLVFGEAAIEETVCGVKYRIPPDAFFYMNKLCGEEVSKSVLKMLDLSAEDVVVDLYTGIGLLALQAAPFVKKVFGFEVSRMSIEYARQNVELNGFNNVVMMNSKSEDGLSQCRDEIWDKDVAVVASAPMDGFRASIIAKLRSMPSVKRVVYVTPRPPTLETKCCHNLFQLMLPERRSAGVEGPPFVAVNAVPYNLAPHSKNYGLIVNFERHSRFTY